MDYGSTVAQNTVLIGARHFGYTVSHGYSFQKGYTVTIGIRSHGTLSRGTVTIRISIGIRWHRVTLKEFGNSSRDTVAPGVYGSSKRSPVYLESELLVLVGAREDLHERRANVPDRR